MVLHCRLSSLRMLRGGVELKHIGVREAANLAGEVTRRFLALTLRNQGR